MANNLKRKRINYIALIISIGFAASSLFHSFQGFILHRGYPYNTFLFRPEARFSDFFQIIRQSREISYLPFVNILIYLFEFLGAQTSFFIFAASSIILLFLINRRELLYSLIFTFLTYPVLFALDRGNIEILVFFLLYFFLDFFRRGKNLLSALFLAGAISIKLFPAVFLILFLAERKFREIFYTLGLVLVFNLAALLTFKEGIISRLQVQMENIRNYGHVYQLGDLGLPFGHSLWGLFKESIYNLKGYSQSGELIRQSYNVYPFVALLLFLFVTLYIIFIEKEFWKKVLLIVISMNLLPYVSPDYKLLYFFIPLYLFINSRKKDRYDMIYIVLFALLLIPKSYLQGKTTDISISVILNPLIMMVLAGLVIISGIRQKKLSPAPHNDERLSAVRPDR